MSETFVPLTTDDQKISNLVYQLNARLDQILQRILVLETKVKNLEEAN